MNGSPASLGFAVYLLAGILGACMGSFLNCYAWRVVNGESVWKGRSHCDECGHVLGVRDLIPVLSYLMSHGKCRYCGAKLSIRHLIAELVTALVFVSITLRYGFTLQTLQYLLLACALLACSFADLEAFLIPDRFLVFAAVVRVVFIFLTDDPVSELVKALIGGAVISAAVLVIALIMGKLMKTDVMGGGDVKLLFVIGLYLGWQRNFFCLILACVLGALFGLAALRKKKSEEEEGRQFPWGPSIAIAAWAAMLWGTEIIQWYVELLIGR